MNAPVRPRRYGVADIAGLHRALSLPREGDRGGPMDLGMWQMLSDAFREHGKEGAADLATLLSKPTYSSPHSGANLPPRPFYDPQQTTDWEVTEDGEANLTVGGVPVSIIRYVPWVYGDGGQPEPHSRRAPFFEATVMRHPDAYGRRFGRPFPGRLGVAIIPPEHVGRLLDEASDFEGQIPYWHEVEDSRMGRENRPPVPREADPERFQRKGPRRMSRSDLPALWNAVREQPDDAAPHGVMHDALLESHDEAAAADHAAMAAALSHLNSGGHVFQAEPNEFPNEPWDPRAHMARLADDDEERRLGNEPARPPYRTFRNDAHRAWFVDANPQVPGLIKWRPPAEAIRHRIVQFGPIERFPDGSLLYKADPMEHIEMSTGGIADLRSPWRFLENAYQEPDWMDPSNIEPISQPERELIHRLVGKDEGNQFVDDYNQQLTDIRQEQGEGDDADLDDENPDRMSRRRAAGRRRRYATEDRPNLLRAIAENPEDDATIALDQMGRVNPRLDNRRPRQMARAPRDLFDQILAHPGVKKFGFTRAILAKMPPAAIQDMVQQLGIVTGGRPAADLPDSPPASGVGASPRPTPPAVPPSPPGLYLSRTPARVHPPGSPGLPQPDLSDEQRRALIADTKQQMELRRRRGERMQRRYAVESERLGFHRAIAENPDDEAPKLAYADWLQDRGDPRHEIIRASLRPRTPFGSYAHPIADWKSSHGGPDYYGYQTSVLKGGQPSRVVWGTENPDDPHRYIWFEGDMTPMQFHNAVRPSLSEEEGNDLERHMKEASHWNEAERYRRIGKPQRYGTLANIPGEAGFYPHERDRVLAFGPKVETHYKTLIQRSMENRPGEMPQMREIKALGRAGESARGGYHLFHTIAQHLFGHDEDARVAFPVLNSVFSANTDVPQHTGAALVTTARWMQANKPDDRQAINKILDSVKNIKRVNAQGDDVYAYSTLRMTEHYRKAGDLLEGLGHMSRDIPEIMRSITGKGLGKTPNFGAAFLHANGAPVDTHYLKATSPYGLDKTDYGRDLIRHVVQQAGLGRRSRYESEEHYNSDLMAAIAEHGGVEALAFLKGFNQKMMSSPQHYLAYKALTGQAAHDFNWTVREMQEAVWTGILSVIALRDLGVPPERIARAMRHDANIRGWNPMEVIFQPRVIDELVAAGVNRRDLDRIRRHFAQVQSAAAPTGPVFTRTDPALSSVARRITPSYGKKTAADPIRTAYESVIGTSQHLIGLTGKRLQREGDPRRYGRADSAAIFEKLKENPHDDAPWLALADSFGEDEQNPKPHAEALMRMVAQHGRPVGGVTHYGNLGKYDDRARRLQLLAPDEMPFGPPDRWVEGRVHDVPFRITRYGNHATIRMSGGMHSVPLLAAVHSGLAEGLEKEFDRITDKRKFARDGQPIRYRAVYQPHPALAPDHRELLNKTYAKFRLHPSRKTLGMHVAAIDEAIDHLGAEGSPGTVRQQQHLIRQLHRSKAFLGSLALSMKLERDGQPQRMARELPAWVPREEEGKEETTGWVPVQSSWIAGLKLTPDERGITMTVKKGGKQYPYPGFGLKEFRSWVKAVSPGGWWWNHIGYVMRGQPRQTTKKPEAKPKPARVQYERPRRYMGPHSDIHAFLRAMAENPEDQATRLVFADWLDDHMMPETARMFRNPQPAPNPPAQDRPWRGNMIGILSSRRFRTGIYPDSIHVHAIGHGSHFHGSGSFAPYVEFSVSHFARPQRDQEIFVHNETDPSRALALARELDLYNALRPEEDALGDQRRETPEEMVRDVFGVDPHRLKRPGQPRRYAGPLTDLQLLLGAVAAPKAVGPGRVDQAPALVLADYLDEHDMPAHARVIRKHLAERAGSQQAGSGRNRRHTSVGEGEIHNPGPRGDLIRFMLLHPGRFVVSRTFRGTGGEGLTIFTSAPVPRTRKGTILKSYRPELLSFHHPYSDWEGEGRRHYDELIREGAIGQDMHVAQNWPERGISPEERRRLFRRQGQPVRMAQEPAQSFAQALRTLTSPNVSAFAEAVQSAYQAAGIQGETIPIIHDTPQTSRPSILGILRQQVDPARMLYATAWHGIMSKSPAMEAFVAGEGPDSLLSIAMPGSAGYAREVLNHIGVSPRLIRPDENFNEVIVHDKGRKLKDQIMQLGLPVRELTGKAVRLNGMEDYRAVSREFEDQGNEGADAHAETQGKAA